MRIAILTNAFPPDGRGGAERIAFAQADAFGVMGHAVRVWASGSGVGNGQRTVGEHTLHGIDIERFPSHFGELGKMPVLRRLAYHMFVDRRSRKDVAERITAWKPDVLLTHNLTGCGFGTAGLVQSCGVRWIHTLHDIQLTDPSGQETVAWSKTFIAKMWRTFWSAWRRAAFGNPDVVISPTQWLLDWHERHGWFPRKGAQCAPTGIVIPNPVEITGGRDRAPHRPATVAYVGRLSGDKGFDLFLETLTRLDQSVVGRAVVVGDGPMMERARDLRDARLELRGRLSPEESRRVIADADLLVAPSRILENQQTILLEAMDEGTPVVATDTGGTKETLERTGCPVIVDADAQKIAEAICDLIIDDARWSRVSRAMRERANRHDPERYFSDLTPTYLA